MKFNYTVLLSSTAAALLLLTLLFKTRVSDFIQKEDKWLEHVQEEPVQEATEKDVSGRCTAVKFGEQGSFPLTSLSSYPGSGNTWVRYLIEEYTGYYTGSLYNDNSLYRGGFLGELADWRDGSTIAVKVHNFKDDRELDDAIILIRSPFDAILANFNRKMGIARTKKSKNGINHHTGGAEMEDFESEHWLRSSKQVGRADRWLRLYEGNLKTRKTLPIFYEDLKANPVPEMKKIGVFLDRRAFSENDQDALDCMFGDDSTKFKRNSTSDFDPWSLVSHEAIERINAKVIQLNETLYQKHGLTLPSTYMRDYQK